MRAGGRLRGARTISLALVAGVIAFETILALSAGAVGIPGVVLLELKPAGSVTDPAAPEGGESDFAKLLVAPDTPSRTPVEDVKQQSLAQQTADPPRLDGLADIPFTPLDPSKPDKPDQPQHFAANSAGREVLPWDAAEPVPYPAKGSAPAPADITAALPASSGAAPRPRVAPLELPASRDVEAWVKAAATEIKGEERARPLYHFEFWLEPPDNLKRRLVAVVYEFNTPAVMPQTQVSSEQKTGFRVSAGGLGCADKVTITLKFDDGQTEQVAVDGCKLLS